MTAREEKPGKCPWCGGGSRILHRWGGDRFQVICENRRTMVGCGVGGPRMETRSNAILEWNRIARPTPSARKERK